MSETNMEEKQKTDQGKAKENRKITARNAIQIGLHAAFLFFLSALVGSIGFIPVLYPVAPMLIAVVCGPVFFLFLGKVRHFGMIAAVATLQGVFLAVTGHGIYSLVAAIVLGLISDLICRMGQYRSFKHSLWGYAVYAVIMATSYFPMIFSADAFYTMVSNSMSAEYADRLRAIMRGPMFIVAFAGAFVGGIIGAFLGRTLARRHFRRSGAVK